MKRLTLLLIPALLAAAEAPKEWTPAYQMKIRNVGDVTPSPDGKSVAWTQTRAMMEGDKSENVTHIWLARIDGSNARQVTRGEKSANSPMFSPDSRWLYFVSPRDGQPKLFRLPLTGGEAEAVFEFRGTAANYRLSPDGKWFAFTGREQDTARQKAVREKTDFRVVGEDPPNNALWVVSSDPEIAAKTPPRKLTRAERHAAQFDWSPDSRRIAYAHTPSPEFNVGRHSDISEVVVESGELSTIASSVATEGQPRYSPDGRYIAYVRTTGGVASSLAVGSRITLFTRANGQVRELAATFDESPNITDWSPDSRRIYFTEGRRTKVVLYAMPIDAPPVELLVPAKGTLGQGVKFNESGTHAGLTLSAPDEAPEAYVIETGAPGRTPVRVSRANLDLPKPPFGETRVVRWKAKDGMEIEGLLTLPVGYQAGTRVPLVLNIHGGPAGVFGESFIAGPGLYPVATFAAKGWATLRCNIRGSSSYGRKFRAANFQDWGGMDYQDLMAGVDAMIAQGIADADKLAVNGWSYGGYMTSWVVSQTGRFKSAAVGAGITNLVSMWGTNDIPSTLDDYFGGPHWEQWDGYVKASAMAFVKNVTTPTLILHGEVDPRVPPGQGYEFYNALKRRGVETKMVVYPRTPHGPSEPKFTQDIMERHVAWIEAHFK